jgi:hypothetical protein
VAVWIDGRMRQWQQRKRPTLVEPRELFGEPIALNRGIRPRLLEAHAGCEPRHDVQPPDPPALEPLGPGRERVVHHEGNEEIGSEQPVRAVEPRRRDADDRKRLAVQSDRRSDDAAVRSEAGRPQPVGQDDH